MIEILTLDNPNTRLAEISSWENAMGIAIGQYGKEWTAEQKLAYQISSLSGLAHSAWSACSLNPEYERLKQQWVQGGGQGPFLGNILRNFVCGTMDATAERAEEIAYAKILIHNMEYCSMAYVKEYTEAFLRLYAVIADIANQDLLHSFYMKLPTPWN